MGDQVILVVCAIVSSVLTYYLAHDIKQGTIRASAIISLAAGLLSYFSEDYTSLFIHVHFPFVCVGGSFVGMSSSQVGFQYSHMVVGGFIFGMIYWLSNLIFMGYGGSLGTMACISVLMTWSICKLIPRGFTRNPRLK